MTKLKTPLLSLGAHGSIGDIITVRRWKQRAIAEKKPVLPYFLTLPTQYQRWLYQDYAYLWTQQSAATKRLYEIAGAKRHLTGLQYWMSYQLTYLPDILAAWHMDYVSDSILQDFSRNAASGTVYGTSITAGVIDHALLFDGIDNYVNCAATVGIIRNKPFSVEFFTSITTLTGSKAIVSKGIYGPALPQWYIRISGAYPNLVIYDGSNLIEVATVTPLVVNTPYHIAFTAALHSLRVYINGVLNNEAVTTLIDCNPIALFKIGFIDSSTDFWMNGYIDELRLSNRTLDATEILRHSLRRWP